MVTGYSITDGTVYGSCYVHAGSQFSGPKCPDAVVVAVEVEEWRPRGDDKQLTKSDRSQAGSSKVRPKLSLRIVCFFSFYNITRPQAVFPNPNIAASLFGVGDSCGGACPVNQGPPPK